MHQATSYHPTVSPSVWQQALDHEAHHLLLQRDYTPLLLCLAVKQVEDYGDLISQSLRKVIISPTMPATPWVRLLWWHYWSEIEHDLDDLGWPVERLYGRNPAADPDPRVEKQRRQFLGSDFATLRAARHWDDDLRPNRQAQRAIGKIIVQANRQASALFVQP